MYTHTYIHRGYVRSRPPPDANSSTTQITNGLDVLHLARHELLGVASCSLGLARHPFSHRTSGRNPLIFTGMYCLTKIWALSAWSGCLSRPASLLLVPPPSSLRTPAPCFPQRNPPPRRGLRMCGDSACAEEGSAASTAVGVQERPACS